MERQWFVRPCTGGELAKLYKVTYKVFLRHIRPILKKIGKRNGNYYMINQVLMIIEFLGKPPDKVEIIYPRQRLVA